MKMNTHFTRLKDSYLFVEIANRVAAYTDANPNADIIRLGIGDVTRPLAQPVVEAMSRAVSEMGSADTFRGYGPEQGYDFLRKAVQRYYAKRGVTLELDEIFISDGAKSDMGNLSELFAQDNTVLIPDPVYPAYVDANLMAGRPIEYIAATRENNFLPLPNPQQKVDLIYMCSPNNPTGAAYNKKDLTAWVDYALDNNAVILFDSAYEAFIGDDDVPHSIFEIDGADQCAIEIASLSKTAGFTGTRCGYTVIPKVLQRGEQNLNQMWARRQATKFNEVPYIVQRGAEAVFSDEGMAACLENINYYKQNAAVIGETLKKGNLWFCGGDNGPYIWLACPGGLSSWDFFDLLLKEANVVGTPGAGFGKEGEGYFRLTGFGDAERTKEASQRIEKLLKTL